MAKIIYDSAGNFSHYEPGVIYHLVVDINGTDTPFYVGETHNPEQRLRDHILAGKNADETSTLVYRTIHDFDQANIPWTMKIVAEYGQEGPTDLEDEWIMSHLVDGHALTNMKKGNAQWLEERQQAAGDMRIRGIRSYRRYREILTQEEANRRHAEWLAESNKKELSEWIQSVSERHREQTAAQVRRRQRKEERARATAREREAWLRSLRFGDSK